MTNVCLSECLYLDLTSELMFGVRSEYVIVFIVLVIYIILLFFCGFVSRRLDFYSRVFDGLLFIITVIIIIVLIGQSVN